MSTATVARRLSDAERARLMADLDRDGYCILPDPLPEDLRQRCITAIDRIASERRRARQAPAETPVKVMNIVDEDPAFRELMLHEPALQLAYDAFGAMFHLCQSNLVSRPNDGGTASDFLTSAPWHADGPRPGLFPSIGGAMGLHYLKFGYFLTDLRHGDGGSLQVVRGSHRRPELDGRPHGEFRIDDHRADLVRFDCAPGTVVAFHQAQWHAAPPNRSAIERKNAYLSYCPTWMRPFDRELLRQGEGADLTDEERWLLGEWRPAARWWLPEASDERRMARFRRDGAGTTAPSVRYD
jgi:ectoine hydroxylase-related dioxygenase (phytanoyl-CoA dioxygenase family)